MNDKLQRIYYIIGIIQRITMIILTFSMIGAAYKIYKLSIQSYELLQKYGNEIKDIHLLIETIKIMLHKSWLF